MLYKKVHINKGDYQQSKGQRSEKRIPSRKIQGFKKFDKVLWKGQEFFIEGRMSTGYAILMTLDGNKAPLKPIPKFSGMKRIAARKSCLIIQSQIENIH